MGLKWFSSCVILSQLSELALLVTSFPPLSSSPVDIATNSVSAASREDVFEPMVISKLLALWQS